MAHRPTYRVKTLVPVGDIPAGAEGLGDPFELHARDSSGEPLSCWLVRFPNGRQIILGDSEVEPLLEPRLIREEGRQTSPPLRPFLPQGLGSIQPYEPTFPWGEALLFGASGLLLAWMAWIAVRWLSGVLHG